MRAAAALAVSLAVLLSIHCLAEAGPPQYGDPIDLPNAPAAADPSVISVGDTYYMYPTTDWQSVECWSSEDMRSWTYEGVVWQKGEPGSWNDGTIWAPDVLQHDDRFFLYYSANQMIGVAESASPTGPFVDVYDHPFIGGGYGDTSGQAIDANAFLDPSGDLYIYCAWHDPLSLIRAAPMADPVTLGGPWTEVVLPQLNWESLWIEGPWMLHDSGEYYLMYSGSSALLPFYAVGYARAQHPLGPFGKYDANPILKADWDYDIWGPGHNSVVRDQNGSPWIFYHTKISPERGWDRVVRCNRLDFDDWGNLYVVLREPDPHPDDDDDDITDDDDDDDIADDDDDMAPDDDDSIDDDDDDDSGFCA